MLDTLDTCRSGTGYCCACGITARRGARARAKLISLVGLSFEAQLDELEPPSLFSFLSTYCIEPVLSSLVPPPPSLGRRPPPSSLFIPQWNNCVVTSIFFSRIRRSSTPLKSHAYSCGPDSFPLDAKCQCQQGDVEGPVGASGQLMSTIFVVLFERHSISPTAVENVPARSNKQIGEVLGATRPRA
ncbi:hypothetical protein JCM3775_003717 [Rhodotorula graminis]